MSCAVFTLIGAYVLAFKKSSTWALWVMFGAAIAMLLVASFLAWRDEHSKVVGLEGKFKTPEFNLTINNAWFGTRERDQRLVIVAGGFLENPFGPPSAAVNWTMTLDFGGKVVIGEIPISTDKDIS